MALAHLGGLPVEETLPGLIGPITVYLAAGGIALRVARKRLGKNRIAKPTRRLSRRG
jgi:hypothetical protein